MKDINPVKGKYYIDELIAQGEHEHQDFKHSINDARKIARSISAFANNGGGHLLIGVKDNGVIAGVRNEEDIYVVEQAASRYCRPAQEVHFTAFNVGGGQVVMRATIDVAARRPVMACDTDGRWKVFFRVADENIVADRLMVAAWERSADDCGGTFFQLSDAEQRILDQLDASPDGLALRQLALAAHISTDSAEQMVVRLASVSVLGFRYAGNGNFLIIRADGE